MGWGGGGEEGILFPYPPGILSFSILIFVKFEADRDVGMGQLWLPYPQGLVQGWVRDPSPTNRESSPGCFCRSWRNPYHFSLVRSNCDLEAASSHVPTKTGKCEGIKLGLTVYESPVHPGHIHPWGQLHHYCDLVTGARASLFTFLVNSLCVSVTCNEKKIDKYRQIYEKIRHGCCHQKTYDSYGKIRTITEENTKYT